MLPLLLPLLWAGSLVHSRRYAMPTPDSLTMQKSLTVQEGLCAFVPCSIDYLWPYWYGSGHGYWYRTEATSVQGAPVATNNRDREVQEETRGRFLLLGDPRMGSCSLDIRDARRTDEGLYHFQGEREYGLVYPHQWNTLFLSVTALNHTPDILIPGTLDCGRPTNLTCSVPWACERGTPPLFSWTSAAHTSLGPWTHNLSSVLTLTPWSQDHGTNLTCQVQLPAVGVTVERTVQLNVTCASQSPAISLSPAISVSPAINVSPAISVSPAINVSPGDGPGKSASGPEVVLVAIMVAAAKTLFLFICLIILIVRYHRKKVMRPTKGMRDANTESS